jgi:signal transduction histidine kinase/ligand-binding sensor domain-containing protein/DNA-binding response OmpR family regulator
MLMIFCIHVKSQNFYNITMADGLSHSLIYTIGQDKYGFMWIGTANGLNVYDGIDFIQFFADPENDKTIPGNNISDLYFEGDSVWVGTRSGLALMHVITKECRKINLGRNTDVRTIYRENNTPFLWVGTQSGLIRYNIEDESFREFNTTNSNISHNIVRAIYKDQEGNLWIGTFDKLNKLPPNSTVFYALDIKKDYMSDIDNNLVICILPWSEQSDTDLLIGTETSLALLNRHTENIRFFRTENTGFLNETIKCVYQSKSGKYWFGTDFGLYEMGHDFSVTTYLHDPNNTKSLINSIVWDIFEDASGAIWFGTNNGVSILQPNSKQFSYFPTTFQIGNKTVGYEVLDIIEDRHLNYWIATQNGVVEYSPDIQILEKFNTDQPGQKNIKDRKINTIHEDTKGRIWIGSNGGLYIWDPSSGVMNSFTADFTINNGLRSNYIYNFIELSGGTIIFNTHNRGLHRVSEKENTIKIQFIGDFGESNFVADNKYLWTFQNSKLTKINTKTFEVLTEYTFFFNGKEVPIHSIHLMHDSVLWLGANNKLLRYSPKSKKSEIFEIKTDKNLTLINIMEDNCGDIWATSHAAIIKFSAESQDFDIYLSGEEIPVSRFESGSSYKCENGDLLFGGQDGFIRFNPDRITKSDFNSPVKITKLLLLNQEIEHTQKFENRFILNKPIAFTDEITLKHSEKSFSLLFSSLHFGHREGIRYAWKLDEVDPEWNYMNGSVGIAKYTNLKPGKYIFRVRGSNIDGVWNSEETILFIRVKPPVWATTVFIILYFVLFISISLGIIFFYLNRIKLQNELKIIRLEKAHSENIALTRQRFFTSVSHEYRTPLSLIIGPAEKLMKNPSLDQQARRFVEFIENNAKRLLWLNNQLIDFRKIENKNVTLEVSEFDIIKFTKNILMLFSDKAERKNIHYEFYSDIEQLTVSMDLRKIETILFNLLSNAFKFTPINGNVSVSIHLYNVLPDDIDKQTICIKVNDSGIGIREQDKDKIFQRFFQSKEAIQMERGSGIGLTIVSEYVKLHGGKIELQSELGKGSKFQVILPLKKNYDVTISKEINHQHLFNRLSIEKGNVMKENKQNFLPGYPNILLVEDDKEMIEFITLSLKNKYNIIVTENGQEALYYVEKSLPNLIVSDILMPILDGLSFTKKIKSNPRTAHIPLILLSGQNNWNKQKEGFASGADAYIVKPFEIDLLELRIENFLKRSEQLYEYLKIEDLTKPNQKIIASQDEKMLEKIIVCIEKHLSDPDLQINKICKETGFSYNLLNRKVKNLTGQTINKFIQTIRLRNAEHLLKTKKFSISEVMDHTGFTNHSYFSKCFKRYYKLSPKDFIKNL